MKNNDDLLKVIDKMQVQLFAIDQKLNTLIQRVAPGTKITPMPAPVAIREPQPNNHQHTRPMYSAVCADCQKACEVPFKPTEGKPVYCKECYPKHKKF